MSELGASVPGTVGLSITKLVAAEIKDVWPTEPQHFTPWLLENAGELSDVLGLQIELDDREHKVGTFSLDLIGRVSGSEQVVIVENQYGETDHRHLGQIMTYAGGTEPAVIIWIAERFREEHRAALDWLNQNTHPDVRFFGVRLGAVRMVGAPQNLVAPRLELVCKPNDWEKLAKLEVVTGGSAESGGLTPVNALYKQFWEKFAELAKERGWTNATPPAQNWWSMPSGTSSISWGVSYSNFGCRSELYFGAPDPQVNHYRLSLLEQKHAEFVAAFGDGSVVFDHLPGKVATRVDVRLDGPKISNTDEWDDVLAWMVDTQERLRLAVSTVGGIPTAVPPLGWQYDTHD